MKNTLKKVLKYSGKNKFLFILTIILTIFTVAVSLYIPIIAGDAIDVISENHGFDISLIKQYLVKLAILAAAGGIIQWIVNVISNKIIYSIVRDIRNDTFAKIQHLPLSYLDSHPTGDIVSRIITDADNFAEGLLMGFTRFFTGVMTIFGTLFFMIKISRIITPVVALLTPLSLFVAKFVASHTHSMFSLKAKSSGKQTSFISETVSGKKIISSYNFENATLENFDEINDEFAAHSLKAIFYSSITNPSTRFVNNIIYAVVAMTGAFCAIGGSVTIGGLTCFLTYAGQYAKPFNEISDVIAELQNSIACAERLFEIIDCEEEPSDKENAAALANAEGSVKIENVSFSYVKDRELIKNLNIDADKGSRIAIVGPTGCGKTTVINLLMRFYDVDDGKISLDNIDIRDIKRHSLRKNYGMVLQETFLKTGTVRENIAFGNPDATDDEIIAAAKSAHAHSFIKRLPQGYDTVISDESSGISQGQKQLICIARVMLSLPPVLILDEATSSIDTRTELKIRSAFDKMMRGRTSFVVAHRLSTIKNSDLILVMKDGMVIEKGNHNELLEKGGFYAELYNSRMA